MLTDYTTYDDIRATLGVSDDDITDTTLALALYDDSLTQELEDIDTTLPDTFAATNALAAPTAQETRFLKACRLFATFSVARQLAASLPLFAAKQMSDGKAQVSRFDNPYKDVVAAVLGQYGTVRTRLIAAFESLGTDVANATPKPYFSIVSPSTDPVTGS